MHEIAPTRETFDELSKSHKCVPVLGRAHVKDFDMSALFNKFHKDSPEAFLFESGTGPEEINRYSLMGASNSTCMWFDGSMATLSRSDEDDETHSDPLSFLQKISIKSDAYRFDYSPPFWGGWVGFIGYEFAQWLERLTLKPGTHEGLPEYFFMQVDKLWVYEHATGHLNYIVSVEPGKDPVKNFNEALVEIDKRWELFSSQEFNNDARPSVKAFQYGTNGFQSNLTSNDYENIVHRAKQYIEDGDIYQANLVQKFSAEMEGCPFDLYLRLKKINPAPFSGYMNTSFGTLVSSSPERLVKVEGGNIETRPIAGTRPRGINIEEDEKLSSELLLNEKEKAEHLMLVDLERNDLGRICQTGTVEVDSLMFLEKYSHVIHIVSNIRGRLKNNLNLVDVLRAVFPGGTITGCPKIRCMEIIDELETERRGPYSGSMGYIGFGSALDLNILIRTIVIKEGEASFHVGAGIVADSNPKKEYQETLDKAAAMIEALKGDHP